MGNIARQYRTWEEFTREELLRPDDVVRTLDEFHRIDVDESDDEEEIVDLVEIMGD